MFKLYERIQKTSEYPYGSKPIKDDENPFASGPCLLCLAAVPLKKSVFGMSSMGMEFARVRTTDNPNAKFDINNFPAKFLSLNPEHTDSEKMTDEDYIKQFTSTYFFPLISNNGKKLDTITAMKNVRNINILSFCESTLTAQKIEEILLAKMQELGYTPEECSQIQSQMCIIGIATNRLNGTQKSTCISFKDINDTEVNDNITDLQISAINSSPIKAVLFKHSNNEFEYLLDGNGNHSIKKYLTDNSVLPVCVSSIISTALENSINNFQEPENFTPISAELVSQDLPLMMEQIENGYTVQELMSILDKSLSYGTATRLSDEEIRNLENIEHQIKAQIEAQQSAYQTHIAKASQLNKSVQKSRALSAEEKRLQARYFSIGGDLC